MVSASVEAEAEYAMAAAVMEMGEFKLTENTIFCSNVMNVSTT